MQNREPQDRELQNRDLQNGEETALVSSETEDRSGTARESARESKRDAERDGHIRLDSLFGKYISTFVLTLVASFVILALIITGVLGRYAEASKTYLAERAAEELAIYTETRMRETDEQDLGAFVREAKDELAPILSVLCDSVDGEVTVLLVDAEARSVLAANHEGAVEDPALSIPTEMLTDVVNGLEITHVGALKGLSEDGHPIVRAQTLRGGDGTLYGAVFVFAGVGAFDRILDAIMQMVFFAGIAVLLIALIAVYMLTERIIGPLRQMSRAAKSFAAGDFEVVVPVKGRDEVAELAVAFNQMAESLKNLEKMRSTFMANVSHDLRTPMTTISGFIDSILAGAIPPEQHAHYLGIVSGEVKRLSRLVSLTLDISRIQAGDRKFVMAQFDVCETARLILISFEQKIEAKRLDVLFDADSDNMTVWADRDAIYQVLYNICDNAVKFSNEGGRLEIQIRAQKEKKKVQVTVFNEGQGIPPEDLPYVFDQFYKGDKSRGLDKSGAGLGMFISKAIIDAHKEDLWVDSAYGKNCEFGFTLSTKPPHEDHHGKKPAIR